MEADMPFVVDIRLAGIESENLYAPPFGFRGLRGPITLGESKNGLEAFPAEKPSFQIEISNCRATMMIKHHHNVVICFLALLALATGCQGLKNGDLHQVQTTSAKSRVGNVYLIRGLIGVFSTGMDTLSDQLAAAGIQTHVYQDAQWDYLGQQLTETYKGKTANSEPLVLIGHSYGADDVVRVARKLDEAGIPVDLMITVDATVPPNVPKNVKLCYNYFQSTSTDFIPMFRGIPLTPDKDANLKIVNIDLRKERTDLLEPNTNHINIDKNLKLHAVLVNHVEEVCVTRQTWAARHGMPASQPTMSGSRAAHASYDDALSQRVQAKSESTSGKAN
jgi:hypothetical protein